MSWRRLSLKGEKPVSSSARCAPIQTGFRVKPGTTKLMLFADPINSLYFTAACLGKRG
jgi:hypothetical protein